MNILLYLVIVCIWGSTWLAINFQLGNVPITASIFYRFALASFFLFCWSLYKQSPLKFPLKTHLLFAFQGLFMFSLGYIAAYEAGGYISSGLNAIGFSLVLVFNIINGALFSKTPITSSIIMGALCGMVGITVIFWPSVATLDLTNASLFGIVLSVGAGFLASCGNMFATHIQKMHIPVTENNAYAMGYGALCTLLILFMEGSPLHFDFSLSYLASLLYLADVGSVIAFGCYITLLARIGANKAAYALVATPVIALILSTFFEDFVWNIRIFVGAGLILLGNVIILLKKHRV